MFTFEGIVIFVNPIQFSKQLLPKLLILAVNGSPVNGSDVKALHDEKQ